MRLTFIGAARTVTGSMHQVEVAGDKYLLDCGLYQGRRAEARERNCCFPFNPAKIKAVILSHAHIDHSGNLPNLVKQGFNGPIYTTPATADLCRPMISDSAFIHENDAEFMNKRYQRRKKLGVLEGLTEDDIKPLYTQEDAEKTFPLFESVPLGTVKGVGPDLTYQTYEAGHMLGSSSVVLNAQVNGKTLRVAFSGDVGRRGLPIIRDPQTMPEAIDYLICESTYGNRFHEPSGPVKKKLADTINRTIQRNGRVIVPAFAVGRTQQLVVMLSELVQEKAIPPIPVFVDSPLAVNVTEVFRQHTECYDEEIKAAFASGSDPFGFSMLRYIRDVNDSKALNELRTPFIVVSASGMCEAGRILHHLKNNIGKARNTILITGFQAENTLGRKIVDGQKEVNIFGEPYTVRAEVVKLNELSGHADQRELLAWMEPMMKTVKRVFLVHGEPTAQDVLAETIQARFSVPVVSPARGESFELD